MHTINSAASPRPHFAPRRRELVSDLDSPASRSGKLLQLVIAIVEEQSLLLVQSGCACLRTSAGTWSKRLAVWHVSSTRSGRAGPCKVLCTRPVGAMSFRVRNQRERPRPHPHPEHPARRQRPAARGCDLTLRLCEKSHLRLSAYGTKSTGVESKVWRVRCAPVRWLTLSERGENNFVTSTKKYYVI